jgi:cell division septation protein DedD
MRGVFDDRELQQADTRHDTELTLGSTTLLLIFFGLVLLCGLCFGLGYATGHHGSQYCAATAPDASEPTAAQADTGRPKPSANQQATSNEPPAGEQSLIAPRSSAQTPTVAAVGASSSAAQQVKPAFPPTANSIQAGQLAASSVGPALAAMGAVMVQIAAVSQPEDADVLMSALRRRGYAVAAHREPLDGLIHVRIGPFKTRDEAETWRQKLLSDGYNAIVQP